ncbi:MAG: transcriptional regulator [Sphingobacteriales bacterium BACL12 MAG-120813-bin55]|jgi:YebC/PmpR family DNA-binding regulatory protein|nr:MAG: transcriptional regulator [Sphingobacteriales bacterium BACL12 MAG-120802-bin5]KRP11073.1 MAG: transcriptional regulator [Sphingobacteriales bacterium BACL12 MAG-120813-bin55]
MGRAFEYRKEKKFKRWDAMAKNFTRVGREIAIAVKAGGPDPSTNAKLRLALNNAKGVQMPKDRVEAAIKRAVSKDEGDYEEIVYEGYGPFGVAMMIECATDNPTRTVANVRMYFNRGDGALGTQGSVAFSFDRKGVFKLEKEKVQLDDIELDLIDAGAEDIREEEDLYLVSTSFTDFGTMQNKLEELNVEVKAAELVRVPLNLVELTDEQMEKIYALIDKFEEDDDVVSVFHNMKEE